MGREGTLPYLEAPHPVASSPTRRRAEKGAAVPQDLSPLSGALGPADSCRAVPAPGAALGKRPGLCARRRGAGTGGLAGVQVSGGLASTTPVLARLPPPAWLPRPGDCRPKTPRPRASPGRGGEGGGVGGGGSRRKARAVRPREAARAPAGRDSLALGDRGSGGPRPARPGEGRVRRPPPRPTPSRGAESPGPAGAGRGSAWERTPSPCPPLRGRLSHRPGLRRGPAEAAPACAQRARPGHKGGRRAPGSGGPRRRGGAS